MTRASTPPLKDYIENGATLVHAIPFQFNEATEIVCSRIPAGGLESAALGLGSDYTVTGGGGGTGTVTKASGGVAGTTFRIRRATVRQQLSAYQAHNNFPAAVAEITFDRSMQIDQEQDLGLSLLEARTIRAPSGDTIPELPASGQRVGMFMQFALDGRTILLQTLNTLAGALAVPLAPLLKTIQKGDPGSAGEGYSTRAAMALAGNAATNFDDAYLCEAGREGKFKFVVPLPGTEAAFAVLVAADTAQGIYVARTGDATGRTGAWVRMIGNVPFNPCHWGVIAGDVQGNGPGNAAAFKAMQATLAAIAPISGNVGWVRFPQGIYWFADAGAGAAIEIGVNGLTIEGGAEGWGGAATNLKVPHGIHCIRAVKPQSATTVANIQITGSYTNVEGEFYGIYSTSTIKIRNVRIQTMSGDGINIDSSVSGGNADESEIHNVVVSSCRDGLKMEGVDSQAFGNFLFKGISNRRWDWNDSSFLGNSAFAAQCSSFGQSSGGSPYSAVTLGGNRYACVAAHEAGASTNSPTGTTASNLWWRYIGAGGVQAPFYEAWVNGHNYRAGGSIRNDNLNQHNAVYVGVYDESDGVRAQIGAPATILGGFLSDQPQWADNGWGPAPSWHTDSNARMLTHNGLIVKSNNDTTTVVIGQQPQAPGNGDFIRYNDAEFTASGGMGFQRDVLDSGHNFVLTYGYTNEIFIATGPLTVDQFGTGAPNLYAFYPPKLMVGSSRGNARRLTNGPGAPASGTFGKGALSIEMSPAPSGKAANICTTGGIAGSTAVFKPCAAIDA